MPILSSYYFKEVGKKLFNLFDAYITQRGTINWISKNSVLVWS